ncbi:cytochrome P450 [Kocuria palustris]|uniref:cytochrome P450 n=1 Tax=Kocuria palustris TaxID=71999 RepID=UPI0011A529CF|nr:cytochrome P450 [Kocuria palustris]
MSAPMHEPAGAAAETRGEQSPRAITEHDDGSFTVHGHAAVQQAALDDSTFSSAVSRHLQIPNGLDGAEHSRHRALIDRYFTPQAMADVEPRCRRAAEEAVADLPHGEAFDAVSDLGYRFAVAAQSAWLGWPASMADELVEWVRSNQEAARSGDRARTAAVARRFDELIASVIEPRRDSDGTRDVTDALIHDTTAGRLTDEQIVSILRNWTGGDLSSIAQCVGVVTHFLLEHPEIAARIAEGASDAEVDAILEEFLRVEDPFVSNRRIAARDTELAGCPIPEGSRVVLDWARANRDPQVFGDPDALDPHVHAADNLTYGIGRHACPGRPLARLELRELTRALLAAGALERAGDAVPEQPPMGGFRAVPVILS